MPNPSTLAAQQETFHPLQAQMTQLIANCERIKEEVLKTDAEILETILRTILLQYSQQLLTVLHTGEPPAQCAPELQSLVQALLDLKHSNEVLRAEQERLRQENDRLTFDYFTRQAEHDEQHKKCDQLEAFARQVANPAFWRGGKYILEKHCMDAARELLGLISRES